MINVPPQTVLQFGTGRFLRAFADLFLHEVNQRHPETAHVVALQSSGSQRAESFNRQGCRFHVAIRGLREGQRIDQLVEVHSVRRALAAGTDWAEVLDVSRSPSLTTILSNASEAGYALEPEDPPTGSPPKSFPAKLLAVLSARFEAGCPGVTILPCELLEQNADRLRELVLQQAKRWGRGEPLLDWIAGACSWRSTLVDRIVSAPRVDDALAASDPLLAAAEPFALWLIEQQASAPASPHPWQNHPSVQTVEALESYHLRKVRILNGAHTALVAKALPLGFQTVRQAAGDPTIGCWLQSLLLEEIVPVLEGRTESPDRFARQTLERFANPYLDHRLADIALHHEVKLLARLLPTYHDFRARFGRPPRLLTEVLRGVI